MAFQQAPPGTVGVLCIEAGRAAVARLEFLFCGVSSHVGGLRCGPLGAALARSSLALLRNSHCVSMTRHVVLGRIVYVVKWLLSCGVAKLGTS